MGTNDHIFSSLILCLILALTTISQVLSKDFAGLAAVQPSVPASVQTAAVRQLAQRLLGGRAVDFTLLVDPTLAPSNSDRFKLWSVDGKVHVTGSTGVATASGLYHYLRQYCNGHISWGGDQVALPHTLPSVKSPEGLTIKFNDRFRYFANVCTSSYSFVWWGWTEWQQQIDWLALSGYNLPLAFTAQEAIWRKVYLKMGFTSEELDEHFSGPAFLAWQRMGNLRGWGGPLPASWHTQQVALQHRILASMRSLGMTPVLPAFAGHVPAAITRVFPGHNVSHLRDWGRFSPKYCCTTLLDVTDPLFAVIGKAFLTQYKNEFGTNHIYNADTFNEMTPRSSLPAYLQQAGRAVYQGMLAADPQAVWLMQGWLFLNSAFWKQAQAKALLTSVPQGRLIVLDLTAEVAPQYRRLASFYGQPFIWCMLHNYGGTIGLYGVLDSLNTGVFEARHFPNSSLVGTGLTMEGIDQNDVIYEFMNENSWRLGPRDVSQWILSYSSRRYGQHDTNADKAWQFLMRSVYNATDSTRRHQKVLIVKRPSLKAGFDPIWYNASDVFSAWRYMLSASEVLKRSPLFRYDLVDVTRQSLQLITNKLYGDLLKFYHNRNLANMTATGQKILDLLAWLDKILASDDHFLLGKWLESAKGRATNHAESKLYEYNARNQVTLWGPDANILDYACKQWAGLIHNYYRQRWKLFITELKKSLATSVAFDEAQFRRDVLSGVEKPFTFDRSLFPTRPRGDSVTLSRRIYAIFASDLDDASRFIHKLPRFSNQINAPDAHNSYESSSW